MLNPTNARWTYREFIRNNRLFSAFLERVSIVNILPVEVTEMLLEEPHEKRMSYLIQAGCDMGDAYMTTANFMMSGLIFPTIKPGSGIATIPDTDMAIMEEFYQRRATRLAFTSPNAWDYDILAKEVYLARR